MKTPAILALVLALAAPMRADDLPWQTGYDKALAEAKTAHKTVLLDFSASWCGPCRMMENTTFADGHVQDLLKAFTLVKIDIDQEPVLAARYKVDAIPTCIMLNQFGEVINRSTGYMEAKLFSTWIERNAGSSTALAEESKSQQMARVVQELSKALESPDETIREQTMGRLLAIYCAPGVKDDSATDKPPDGDQPSPAPADDGGGAKLVEMELRGLVQRHPAWAGRYLNEPRLAVRILFATLFAANAGADFQFDPWAPPEERAKLADAWNTRLNAH